MACVASWHLGQPAPTILKGSHNGGTPQRWTVTVVAESTSGVRDRWLLRPRDKMTLDLISDYVAEEILQFKKENGALMHLSWTAISR